MTDMDDMPAARWPLWLDEFRLDDARLATAYEATPPRQRAALKTGLALAHMHFGECASVRREEICSRHLGFWRGYASRPVPWALLAFTPEYAAAARLAAACAPALLAGVPLPGAACVGGAPGPESCVTLELSGVEDIFCLSLLQVLTLLEEIAHTPGRLVLLHAGELAPVAKHARTLRIPCREETGDPVLFLPCPDAFDLNVLAFAQGGACLDRALHAGTTGNGASADAAYMASAEQCRHAAAPLVLTPGCEGFWLHPGMGPDFFRMHTFSFGQTPASFNDEQC